MGAFIDLTGQKFGKLTVIERAENKNGRVAWLCKCDCGNFTTVTSKRLRNGDTKSCGCYHKEKISKHNKSNSRLYNIYSHIKQRCYNLKNCRYKNYGGRGITICDEWLHNFQAFYDWAMANGYDDTLTIDRIDNNKGYSPDNCRWITNKEQQSNKCNNHLITYNGKTQTMAMWANEKNINESTLAHRISRGWNIDRALNTP